MADSTAPLQSGQVIATIGGGSSTNEEKATACSCQPVVTKSNPFPPLKDITSPIHSSSTQSIAHGNVDKRVSLTVSPKTYQRDETLYIDKVKYALGSGKINMKGLKGGASSFYGLLRNALGTSSGLIFPYTPTVSFSHQTNYSPIEIIHSNITYQYYKNTPAPSIGLNAKFTADNRDNALHMLSAIWFLIACSKCDFGENSDHPGLPPPVLYLNGYDHLMDNIPVVITSVRYSYPESKHYVNLVLDFSQPYSHRKSTWEGGDTTFNNDNFCKIYTSSSTVVNQRSWESVAKETILPKGGILQEIKTNKSLSGSTSENGLNYSFWLPTDIQIEIGLAVQPNLLKTRKQWTLKDYKTGWLLTNSGKNPPVWLPDSIQSDQLLAAKREAYSSPSDGNCICQEPTSDESGKYYNFIPSGWTW